MKSPHRLLCALLACLPLYVAAQPAPKIFVVDMSKVFEAHPQTQPAQAALKADEQKATTRLQGIEREIRAMADKLKDHQTKLDDPTLSTSQRDAVRAEGQKTAQEMQAKQAEGQQFMTKTQGELQQRAQKLRAQVFADGSKAAADVARRKGGTLVYDRGTLVYADPAFDITNDVVAEIAKFGKSAAAK